MEMVISQSLIKIRYDPLTAIGLPRREIVTLSTFTANQFNCRFCEKNALARSIKSEECAIRKRLCHYMMSRSSSTVTSIFFISIIDLYI